MRTVNMLLGVLLVLSSVSTVNTNKAAYNNEAKEETKCAEPASDARQGPPTHFEPYITLWNGKVEMREEQSLLVGQLVVDCYAGAPPPVFEIVPPAPDFIRITPVPCTCEYEARAKVIAFPRRGDAGKYHISLWARACGGVGQHHNFTLKVKKALED